MDTNDTEEWTIQALDSDSLSQPVALSHPGTVKSSSWSGRNVLVTYEELDLNFDCEGLMSDIRAYTGRT